MDKGIIIAIALTILSRPIELLWDKTFNVKRKHQSNVIKWSLVAVGLLGPIAMVFYVKAKVPFDKNFVILVAWAFSLFLLNLMTIMFVQETGMKKIQIEIFDQLFDLVSENDRDISEILDVLNAKKLL